MNMEDMETFPPAVETAPGETVPQASLPVETVPEATGIFKPIVACLAAALIPGLGHAVLRKWDRALVFLASISIMFALGLYLRGSLFSPDFSDLFATLKFTADAGTGSLYWICRLRGLGIGEPAAYSYDFGNVFIYTAGLLNMLVIVDAFDIALGRKP
jgi:hypothetical protein